MYLHKRDGCKKGSLLIEQLNPVAVYTKEDALLMDIVVQEDDLEFPGEDA